MADRPTKCSRCCYTMKEVQVESMESGFSLLEVIVAFGILAISLAYSTQTISSGTQTFGRSAALSNLAATIANLRAMELKNINGEVRKAGQSEFGMRWEYTSSLIPSGKKTAMYLVRVQVTEPGADAPPYKFNYLISGKP